MKLYCNGKELFFSTVTWSGTDQQSSRELSFSIPSNPYDKDFVQMNIKLGDRVSLYDGSTRLFLGVVTSREKTAEIGSATYTAKDFMHYLLRSTGSYKFKGMTPEAITKRVCDDVGVPVGDLAQSNASIKKIFFDGASLYDIIIKAYRSAKAVTGKNYMLVMDGNKVSVIEKGLSSNVTLTQGINITGATYTDTTDDMVNDVKIYGESLDLLGEVKDESTIEKYGTYQSAIQKEQGVNAREQALSQIIGITRDISIEAIGDTRATSGKAIKISDKATGLKGTYFIASDTHTFENGTHLMSLGLNYENVMEEGAEEAEEQSSGGSSGKPQVSNSATAYFVIGGTAYHSTLTCPTLNGSNDIKSGTVEFVKSIKIASGEHKGERRYKPCSRCWQT